MVSRCSPRIIWLICHIHTFSKVSPYQLFCSGVPRWFLQNCSSVTLRWPAGEAADLLTLNPEAHAQLAVLTGSFTREGSPGHVQLGPAWWWCDHAHGVRDVLEKNAAYGVLSTFIGMTTDSRSILSLARHDWFRRTLCRWVAEKVASGDFPDDESLLRPILEAVCYGNAKRIFDNGRLPAADCNRQPTETGKESK